MNKKRNVCTLPSWQSVLKTCDQRNGKWAYRVQMRVLDCQDLVASEACYRITCIGRFSLNKNQNSSDATTAEQSVCNAKQESFDILCKWLESEAEIYSIS